MWSTTSPCVRSPGLQGETAKTCDPILLFRVSSGRVVVDALRLRVRYFRDHPWSGHYAFENLEDARRKPLKRWFHLGQRDGISETLFVYKNPMSGRCVPGLYS